MAAVPATELAALPPYVNWRVNKGIEVTPIKDQKRTGLCWACAALSCLEAMHTIKTKEVLELSLQQLMDSHAIHRCGDGNPAYAFQHIMLHGGIALERDYKFKAVYRKPQNHEKALRITGYGRIPESDEDALKWAVSCGPVAALIEADDEFLDNKTGVHDKNSRVLNLNHWILIIGYGMTVEGRDCWIIQNSHSEKWGNKGCAIVPRNSKLEEGYCNLAIFAIYPTMEGVAPPFVTPPPLAISYTPCECKTCKSCPTECSIV